MRCYAFTRPLLRSPLSSKLLSQSCRPRCQPFSLSAASPLIEPALGVTHSFIESLHGTTHLPWIACVPLTAIIVRAVLITPLAIYTRRIQQRQAALRPLLFAWTHHFRRTAVIASSEAALKKEIKKLHRAKRKELYKRWHCTRWRLFLPFTQLPLFLVVIETLRRMCGIPGGLLGLFTERSNNIKDVSVDSSREEVLTSLNSSTTKDIFFEPSLAFEGGLWFPDLLLPDPWLVLPFILSGTLFANIHLNTRRSTKTSEQMQGGQKPSIYYSRLTRAFKFAALLIGPVTLQVPSAILVYWITSSTVGLCQTMLLDKFMPVESKRQKEISDRGPPRLT
ncbi:MAG: hypothetical protein M1823_002794 [Watsoniomyces obsoletus]|nr:MAG: hypothetical protein M1823_002794 [Watsoniomyces obsoletus]